MSNLHAHAALRDRVRHASAAPVQPETYQTRAPLPNITSWSTPAMNQTNSPAWVMFTYVSFGVAAFMSAAGVWALPGDLWMKGYMAMANVFLVGACFTLAKTQRDEHEGKRLANRLEDAKAEKLLMGIDR